MLTLELEVYSRWLNTHLQTPSSHQQQIYGRWIERLRNYYGETLSDETRATLDGEHFILGKALTYFYPYYCLLRSPFELPEMETAVSLLREAYESKGSQKIVIYADRDADGVTSASILGLFLRDRMGYPAESLKILLPREEDKYGVTEEIGDRILAEEPDLLITLDCGSSNRDTFVELQHASNKPLKTIILDHHFIPASEEDFPPVNAFVNPKRLAEATPDRDLCTAGLAFKLIWGLTYSYTSDFGLVNEVVSEEGTYYLRNGVKYDTPPGQPRRRIHFGANQDIPAGDINGDEAWAQVTKQNVPAAKLNKFAATHPEALDAGDRMRIIQNLHFIKVYEKVKPYLPLVAVGTIADLMPLVDDNRIFVAQGLLVMRDQNDIIPVGLRELMKAMSIWGNHITEHDIGFLLSPAINAAGRLGNAMQALDLLLCRDPLEAAQKAFELKKTNERRKTLSKEGVQQVLQNIDPQHESYPLVIGYHPEVHRGISGLVASRLAEQFEKAAVVLVEDGECLRGSIRAFQNENVFQLLEQNADLFVQYGGHRQAAGFSLAHEKREVFTSRMYEASLQLLDEVPTAESPDSMFAPPLEIADNEIMSGHWAEWLSFAPYGKLNPHPVMAIGVSAGVEYKHMGSENDHARLNFDAIRDASIEGVWFFHGGKADVLNGGAGMVVHAEPHLNRFGGKLRFQLKVTKVDP